jgi:hypothetical protein
VNTATRQTLMSTGKDDWETPPDLFAALHAEFQFAIDGAANAENHKLPSWWGPGGLVEDALTVPAWRCVGGPIWINCPYSRGLQAKFIAKAAAERAGGDHGHVAAGADGYQGVPRLNLG